MIRYFGQKIETMSEQYICHDLIPLIVSYSSYDSLYDLSKASPIFDAVICNDNRKVFYDDGQHFVLGEKHTIIQTDYGKKYLLIDHNGKYNVNGKHAIYKLDISWTNVRHRSGRTVLYDSKKDIIASVNFGVTQIMSEPLYVPIDKRFVDIRPITDIEQVNYIDLKNRTFKKNEFAKESYNDYISIFDKANSLMSPTIVLYGRFKVLFHNDCWVPADKQ